MRRLSIHPTPRTIALVLLTPFLEKNPVKRLGFTIPVISMKRVIAVAFAVEMIRLIERVGIVGWPDATVCIAIVFTLSILDAMDRVKPDQALALARALFGRFGVGAVTPIGRLRDREPSKYDDHRDDVVRGPLAREAA